MACAAFWLAAVARVVIAGSAASTGGSETVYAVGRNYMGQLGMQDPVLGRPTVVMTGVQAVSASKDLSGEFSVFLTEDGAAKSVGDNSVGQLGDGSTASKGSFVTVFGSGVQAISTGDGFAAYLMESGFVMAAGKNQNGQLGDGTLSSRSTPVRADIAGVTAISAGQWHLGFLRGDGTAWATGWNTLINAGAVGDGVNSAGHSSDRAHPVQVQSVTGVQAISAGKSHTLFLTQDGDVWGTGMNWQGELGLSTNESPKLSPVKNSLLSGVQAVAAGEGCSFFVKQDGTAWATGDNANGRLGDGTTTDRYSPVSVLDGVRSVSSRKGHTLFLKSDGTAYATGGNLYGQLGTGRYGHSYSPRRAAMRNVTDVVAGEFHSFFLTDGYVDIEVPCAPGSTTTSASGTQIRLDVWIPHQGQRSIRCPAGSFGAMFVQCWTGELSIVEDACSAVARPI